MSFNFVTKREYIESKKIVIDLIRDLQDQLRPDFRMDPKIIGSVKRRMVTRNGSEPFDVDMNLIMTYDSSGDWDADEIYNAIFEVLQELANDYGFTQPKAGTRSIHMVYRGRYPSFKLDIAIYAYNTDGTSDIIHYDKISQQFIWNQDAEDVDEINDFILGIRSSREWENFCQWYIERKNFYLRRNEHRKSISVIKELMNEI